MGDIMDETSDTFATFTKQLYESFLKNDSSRDAVVFQSTIWEHYLFTYASGSGDAPMRHTTLPPEIENWIYTIGASIHPIRFGVYVTSDMESGAFLGFYPDLRWSEIHEIKENNIYRRRAHRPTGNRAKSQSAALIESPSPTALPATTLPEAVGVQGRLFDL